MSYKIMPKAFFSDWIEKLRQDYRVVGPQEKHEDYIFNEVDAIDSLRLNYPPTLLPPKEYLVPPREVLLNYHLDASRIQANLEAEATVIVGMHTCDLHALKLLDHVFQQGYRFHRNAQLYRPALYSPSRANLSGRNSVFDTMYQRIILS